MFDVSPRRRLFFRFFQIKIQPISHGRALYASLTRVICFDDALVIESTCFFNLVR